MQCRLKVVPKLEQILLSAANATNLHVVIFSGGQDPQQAQLVHIAMIRYAADVWLYEGKGGRRLSMVAGYWHCKSAAVAARSAGAKSIGAGAGYMDGVGMHIDIASGATVAASSATFWGAGGRSGNVRLVKRYYGMIYDKKKGSLLNYIQLTLHVVTSNGTYLGIGYDFDKPKIYSIAYSCSDIQCS